MNKASHTLSFGDVSFDAIAYAPESMGQAKLAIDAVLTLLRAVGVMFFFMGISRVRRSLVDGHNRSDSPRRCLCRHGDPHLWRSPLPAIHNCLMHCRKTLHLSWN
ncbi:conjugal transfer protein TraQ [Erwinia tracheiphila]|uniref:conjugal transfer protein TraQ n=1 Tax=Erwinia tracheiphila TaxID=65700 RepID=UPI001FD7D7F1|nr:conjugal transfer protein TraQ [Erwinia tracheiphila]